MLINFAKFSSVRIGGEFEVEILNETNALNFKGVVIGACNNILISPNPPKLGILSDKYKFIEIDGEILRVGAKTKSSQIYNFAKRENLANFEFLKGIPGTLGGMLTMNAGLLGYEISDSLISLKTSNGIFSKNELNFTYRNSDIKGIIYEASFKISHGFDEKLSQEIATKRANQPKGASFGSCFKNPKNDSAGRLLESVGLRGYRVGQCGFSKQHANFLINYGDGVYTEVVELINLAKKRVYEEYGIVLECEVQIL
ncbi:MAG: UDP-N-acetylmuramate dehydrogenase [Campylobacter sp.]|nr:UDP-N-acetylmuramate dehydrogenase [Campylobacter sp.]